MVQNQNRALSMLSIAAKAGKVQSGGFLTENAIQEGVAYLVIVAENASQNTQKKFMGNWYNAGQPDWQTGTDSTCSYRSRSGKTDF